MKTMQVEALSLNRQPRKRLILTGDDFGLNSKVNEAVEQLHQAGLLTQASLMVNEAGVEEALRIARRNPGLCVGLHLTLCLGKASHPSPFVDAHGNLPPSPANAGLRYAFQRQHLNALEREIAAQFCRFSELGLPSVYWDGHTHLHLHPDVLNLTLPIAHQHGFRGTRLVREPGFHPLQLIFRLLSRSALSKLNRLDMHAVDRVFGLANTGNITTQQLQQFFSALPDGSSEVYFHPGAEPTDFDFPVLKETLESGEIVVTHFAELFGGEGSGSFRSRHETAGSPH